MVNLLVVVVEYAAVVALEQAKTNEPREIRFNVANQRYDKIQIDQNN